MTVTKHEIVDAPEAPQQSWASRHKKGLKVAAAIGAPVVIGSTVAAVVGLSSGGSSASAEKSAAASARAQNLMVNPAACDSLNALVGQTIVVGNSKVAIGRVTCGTGAEAGLSAETLHANTISALDGKPFNLSISVYDDAASAKVPAPEASDAGYGIYLGDFTKASQEQIYGSVEPTTVDGIPAFYDSQGTQEGVRYTSAVIMNAGGADTVVMPVIGDAPRAVMEGVAAKIASEVYTPQ